MRMKQAVIKNYRQQGALTFTLNKVYKMKTKTSCYQRNVIHKSVFKKNWT